MPRPVDITVGQNHPPASCSQNTVNHYLVYKTCPYRLGHITYKSKRGVDASHADLLKMPRFGAQNMLFLFDRIAYRFKVHMQI